MTTRPSDLVNTVTAAARRVYRALHAGFEESVYHQALGVELRNVGLSHQVERNVEVFYKGQRVGLHRLDFIVEGSLVVELKVGAKLSAQSIAQASAYLKTTELRQAIIINFPCPEQGDIEVREHTVARDQPVVERRRQRGARNHGQSSLTRKARSRSPSSRSMGRRKLSLDDMEWDEVSRRYVPRRESVEPTPETTTSLRSSETTDADRRDRLDQALEQALDHAG